MSGRRRHPDGGRPAVFTRPLTPLEVGGLLLGLAMILACCLGCLVLSVFTPQPAPGGAPEAPPATSAVP